MYCVMLLYVLNTINVMNLLLVVGRLIITNFIKLRFIGIEIVQTAMSVSTLYVHHKMPNLQQL